MAHCNNIRSNSTVGPLQDGHTQDQQLYSVYSEVPSTHGEKKKVGLNCSCVLIISYLFIHSLHTMVASRFCAKNTKHSAVLPASLWYSNTVD